MSDEALLVFSTFPSREEAVRIVTALVEEQLAACGNLLPEVESIYRWKGAVERAIETMAVIKTTRANYARLQERIAQLHPYETPEVIAVPIERGLPSYLAWVADSCRL